MCRYLRRPSPRWFTMVYNPVNVQFDIDPDLIRVCTSELPKKIEVHQLGLG